MDERLVILDRIACGGSKKTYGTQVARGTWACCGKSSSVRRKPSAISKSATAQRHAWGGGDA
jgi:hypothetical protein